jgi:hypothetical protein
VNKIRVLETGSRAPNEPLVWIRRESVFSTNTKGYSAEVGTASWQDLEFVLLFASILLIMAQRTDEESLQLIDVYKTNSILWDPKHNDHYKKILKRMHGGILGVQWEDPQRSVKMKQSACWLRNGERKTKKRKSREQEKVSFLITMIKTFEHL